MKCPTCNTDHDPRKGCPPGTCAVCHCVHPTDQMCASGTPWPPDWHVGATNPGLIVTKDRDEWFRNLQAQSTFVVNGADGRKVFELRPDGTAVVYLGSRFRHLKVQRVQVEVSA